LACLAFVPLYYSQLIRRDDSVTDFFQDWASARNFLEGLPVYFNHRVTIPRYLGKTNLDAGDLFVEVNAHPPTSILLMVPFGALAYRDALLIWNLLSLAGFVVSLVLVWHGLRIPFSMRSVFPAIALILPCFPLLLHVRFGQITLLILLLLSGAWAADRANRGILAGVLLGAAATIKIFPAFMLLFFVITKRWKTVVTGSITVVLLTLLTGWVLGAQNYLVYADTVMPRVAKYRGIWFNVSLPGYWTKLFDPAEEYPFTEPILRSPLLARSATIISCLLVLIATFLSVRRASTERQCDLAYGLVMTAMLLVSPITWDHYLLLALVPLAVAWVNLPRCRSARLLLIAIAIAFWSWPFMVVDLTIPGGIKGGGIAGPLHTLGIGSYQCYALLALFALQIAELRRSDPANA
jgi:alpha-1,2-mannosyltransferase